MLSSLTYAAVAGVYLSTLLPSVPGGDRYEHCPLMHGCVLV